MENDSYSGAFSLLEVMKNALIDDMSNLLSVSSNIGGLLSSIALEISELIIEENICSIQKSVEIVSAAIDCLSALCVDTTRADPYITLDEKTVETLWDVTSIVPEKKREKFQEIVEPNQKQKSKILSIENVKWLLGLIIPMLFSLYLYHLPNKAEEEHLRLHKEENVIEQHKSESLDKLTKLFENFFDGLENQGIDVNLNVNAVINVLDGTVDGEDAILDRVDVVDELDVSESQNDDTAG